MKKLKDLLNEIGFSKRLSKDVEDVTADKFEDFGVNVGQLYQTFLKKDLTADPAIAQKIMNMVDTDDNNVLANQIKDLEFLVNQLPNKVEKRDKIGYRRNEAIDLNVQDDIAILSGNSGEYQGEIEDGKVSFSVIYDDLDTRITDQYDESNIEEFLGRNHAFVELSKKYDHSWDIEPDLVGITINLNKIDESYHAIRGPIDVISQNLSMSTSSEIKQIGQDVFGIVPQDFGEDAEAIGDEIDNILVNSTDDEMKDYFYKYFGAYADEIAQEHGFYQDEVNEDYYEKASDLDRKDIEHKLDTLLDKVKPSPKNMEARQGLKAALKSNNVVMMKKALDHWSNKLGLDEMTNDEFAKAKEADRLEKHPERDKIKKVQDLVRQQKEALQIRAGIIK